MSTIKNQYWNFWFFQKHKKYFYFHNFGRMWLLIEFVLTFSAPIKYAKAQFNSIILTQTDRQTEISVINCFFWLKEYQKVKIWWTFQSDFSYIKPIPSHMMRMHKYKIWRIFMHPVTALPMTKALDKE